MEEKVTIFYIKTSGNIYGYWAGDVGFEVFGEDGNSYSMIMDKLTIPVNDFPPNINNVKVIDGEIVPKTVFR